jgi:L-amino acid N-acyltransferase YncA
MQVTLRQPQAADWPGIHQVAKDALPWAEDGNAEWLTNRQRFEQLGHSRRHCVAEDAEGRIVGYTAVEGEAQPGRFRVFLVTGPELLHGDLGSLLYEQLDRDLRAVEARVAWAREEARDTALLGFLQERGFAEEQRFTIAGLEMVLLEKRLIPG